MFLVIFPFSSSFSNIQKGIGVLSPISDLDKGILEIETFSDSLLTINNGKIIIDLQDRFNSLFVSSGDTFIINPCQVETEYEFFSLLVLMKGDKSLLVSLDQCGGENVFLNSNSYCFSFYSWVDLLVSKKLYIIDLEKSSFYSDTLNNPLNIQLSIDDHGAFDYILEPITVVGSYFKVRIISPSNLCSEASIFKEFIGFVKILDERGLPNLWFFPRGC